MKRYKCIETVIVPQMDNVILFSEGTIYNIDDHTDVKADNGWVMSVSEAFLDKYFIEEEPLHKLTIIFANDDIKELLFVNKKVVKSYIARNIMDWNFESIRLQLVD